jgi:dTDP-glucose pyrophosphorylase
MKPTLLILAAGMGSRYGGLKQIDGVGPNGETIIEYSIYDAIHAGFGKVVFVIRPDIEQAFKETISNKFEDKIEVAYAFQETNTPIEGIDRFPDREKPWGTAHAVLVARDQINEPFAVINADDYYGTSGFQTMAKFLTHDCKPDLYSMIAYIVQNTLSDNGTVSRGVCEMDENNHLTDVVERFKVHRDRGKVFCQDDDGNKLEISDQSLVSMNFWGFHPDIFEVMRNDFIQFVADNEEKPKAEFFIPLIVNSQIKSGAAKVAVLPNDQKWYGVTYKEDKEAVQKAFQKLTDQGIYPSPLWG